MSDTDSESLKNITLDDITFSDNESESDKKLQQLIFGEEPKTNKKYKEEVKEPKQQRPKKQDFEWTKLNNIWNNKLLSNNFNKQECVDQFSCNIENIIKNSGVLSSSLKLKFKKYIKECSFDEFSKIVNNYKFLQNTKKEFVGNLNLDSIKNRQGLIKQISSSEFELQCDSVTLYIISKILNVDFIVLNDKNKEIYENKSEKDDPNIVVILIYKELDENNKDPDFNKYITKLIGIKKNKDIQFNFKRNELPEEINNITDRYNFLLQHLRNVFNNFKINNKKITIRAIIKETKERAMTSIKDSELNKLVVILKNMIEQDIFKNNIKKLKDNL